MNMKRIVLLAVPLLLGTIAQAQKSGIGIHFGAYDFYGPQTDNYFTSDRLIYNYNTEKKATDIDTHRRFFWKPMVKFSYWWQVNPHFDLSASLSLASLEYPMSRNDSGYIRRNFTNQAGTTVEKLLTEVDFRFNYNILPKEDWIVSPYLFAGVNGSYHDPYFGVDIPLGLGLNFNISSTKNLFINLESAYKIPGTEHNVRHLQHSIGFVYWFKPGYKAVSSDAAPVDTMYAPTPVADSDNDGINDDEDQCPTVPGMAQFGGCPDSDGDGISDKDDACPLVAGMANMNGCPDSDNDGISDKDDKCPYVAGTAERQGCPIPDADNDGFNDDVDRCPNAYSKTNQGCPEIRREVITQVEKAAKAIFFETGKATIKPVSFKSLDAVVAVLKADPTLYADIEGHTDNVQPKTYTNMQLSQERADAVRNYFVSKGISADRLTAQGFGETQPVADNATAPGRAQNRRTVIKLRNYAR